MQAVKEGLNSEEKLFETVVNVEKYYKKYKFLVWASVIAVIAYFVISAVTASQEETRIQNANEAFTKLTQKADDKNALAALKSSSSALYDLHRFHEAMKASDVQVLKTLRDSKSFGIADMSKYQYAMLSGDQKALLAYINGGAIYFKDIAILNAASSYIKQTKLTQAQELLQKIDSKSPFYEQAQTLMHFGIAK